MVLNMRRSNRITPLAEFVSGFAGEEQFEGFVSRINRIMGKDGYLKPKSLRNIINGQRRASADLTLAIAEATDWRVTPHMIRPLTFRNPADCVPREVLDKAC